MAIDYELLRKKAKKRDEEKQKRDNYEYSKSMYEGATKNRDNISAGTYKLYYDDYKRNTKAYAKEQKKSINESSGKQLKSVLNMINPFDSVSSSQAKKNFQSAQKSKEEKRTAYDKLKEEYERTNGVGQKKNSILSRMEYVTDKLSGEDTTSSEHKVESADMQNKSKNSQMQYLKESAYYEKQDENNKILKNNEISKLVDLAYQSKLKADISLKEYNRSKQSGQVAFGDNVSAENYTMYDKSYKSAVKEIKKRGYDAESLIDTYSKNMNKQETKKITDSAKEFADKHPVLSRGAYVAAQIGQVAAVPDMIQQGVENAVSDEYRPMDTNTSGFIATNFRNAVQEENTKNLYNYVKKKSGSDTAGKVVSFLDETGLSVADMLSIAYLPEPVTLGIMSCGAAANTAVEATERGLSADKALYTATAAGIAESLFEKISLDKFKGLQATGRTGVFNAVTDALKQSFTEGSEEAFTDISNAITDQIINGDMSELSLKYNNYIKEGATKQQAKSTVAKDFGLQVGESFLGGALSGAVVGSVGTAINKYAFNDVNARKLGDEVKNQNSDEIKSLIDTGLSKDKKSKAYKYAEELQSKAKKYKNSNTYNNVDVLAGDSINDSEIDYSKLNAKRLGQLQTEIAKEGFKENIANAVKGEENESRINKVINKMINGFDLTKYDAKSIADSDKAINAINEQFGSDFTKENISVSSLADLSTKLKSGYTDYSFTYDGYNIYQQRAENAQNEVFEENTQSVTDDVKMPKEVLTAEHQSDNPRYNVNATVTFEDGQQANVRIDSRHPFEINRDSAELKLRTSAGKISYNDISIENNLQKLLVNEIASANFGDAGANAVYLNLSKNEPKNFNGDIRTYVSQAKLIYNLGVAKPDVPFSEFVKKNPVFNSSIKLLGDSAINIYRAGQTDTLNYDKYVESLRDNKKSPAKTERHIEGDYTNISNSDSTIDDVFIKVAKKTRVDIERHSDGKKAGNGQFVPSLAKIIINADGSGEYNALIHELGEFGLAYNEKEYKKIQSAIRDWYVDFRGAENFNALVDAYVDTYSKAEGTKTRAEALDELTNDAVSGLFSTDEGIEHFMKWLDENKTEPEKRSIIETITDFLKSVIEKIKNVIATSNLQMAARDAMEMEQKRAENIRKQFLDMLDNASENLYGGVEAENNTKYSLDSYNKKQIDSFKNSEKIELYHSKEQLQKFVNDARQHKNLNKKMYFGVISNEMAEYIKNETGVDVKGYNVALRADNILKIFNSHGNETFELSRGQRAITDEDILKLPQLLNNIDYAEYAGKYNGMQNSNNDFINLKSSKDDTITIGAFKQKKYLDLRIHTMYAKNKGNNDDTANAKALASTSETSVGNVSFNSSISKYSDNVKKISLSVPIEETKELVAIHNTTESKLLSALELGGLPSPSIAIMKAQNISANNEFGDISLVFDKKTIDPQESNANKVYSSDAYTPISVKAEHKLNEKKAWDLYSKINNLVKQKLAYKPNASLFHPDNFKDQVDSAGSIAELVNKYKNDYAFKELYLADKSEPVRDIVRKEKKTTLTSEDTDVFDFLNDNIKDTLQEIENKPLLPSRLWVERYDRKIKQSIADYYKSLIPGISDEGVDNIFNNSDEIKTAFQRKAFVKKAIDYLKNGAEKVELVSDDEATHNLIDDKINQKEYENWLNDLFDGVVEKKGIWKGNDPFTESGNRKNWESLYWDYSLENIVKAMNNQNAQGGNFLVSNIIGGSAKKYNSLDEIRNDKSRLQNVNDEEYNQIRNNLYKRFQEIAQSMTKNDNPFAVADIIVDGVAKTETKSGLANYLKTELKGWANYSDMAVDDIWALVNDIRALPTSYFEAKPQRAVYFNEVYTAVIPDNSSEALKNGLEKAGVAYAEYKAGDEKSRLDVVNSFDDVKFSRDVDVDEFDDTDYNEIRLGKKEYAAVSSAITIRYANRYSDEIRSINYGDYKYYFIYNENGIRYYDRYNIEKYLKGMDDYEIHRKAKNNNRLSGLLEASKRYDSSSLSSNENGRTAGNIDSLDREALQAERQSDRYGYRKDADNDNTSKKRYSRDVDYAEYADLKRENKHLKEVNEILKHQFELTNGREVSTNALVAAGRKIIKLTPTRMTGIEVGAIMKNWYKADSSQELFNEAYNLAEKLIDNEKVQKYQPTESEQEMLDYLKNTKIKLSDKQKNEVAYYFGSYGKYKNAARGKLNITDDGILLDDLSNEMEEMFGNLMPSDNSQDLPLALLDLVNTYRDKIIANDYGYSKEEYLDSLANDILSTYFQTPLLETKADKNEKRFLKAKSKYAEQVAKYRKELAEEKVKHKKEFSAFRKEQVHKNQQYRSDLYRDTIQYKAEFRQNYKEEKLKAEYRKRIKRNLSRIASLAKQTKTKHIPNNMVESVRDLVYTVTTDTKFDDMILDKIKNLNDSFTQLSAGETDTYNYITDLYNDWLMKDLAALENSIGNKTVAMLNSRELSKLDDVVSMTLTTIGKANKLFGYERNKTIEKSAAKVNSEIENISVKQIKNKYLQSLGYNSMKPEYFFEYLGSDELLKLYRDVRKGENTWAVTISDSKNYADDIRKKYNWKNWDFGKITEYEASLGEKLKFDLQDLMSLYAFSRREQAKNHILHGGIKFADTKNKKKSNEYSTHKLSKQDLKYLTNLLTEEQKAYVRDMVNYLSTEMAEKGNEVTRQLYDVELFKEQNYFPMKVDGDSLPEKSSMIKGSKKIKNSGMTNATVEGAKQALILDGFDSVWATHIDDMAKYHAFTLPLENFDKVYNYSDIDGSNNLTSIKEKIKKNYGNEAISYISKLIEDINGGVIREPGSDIVDKLTSLFKKNAVFASASVAIQQPSAIGRALSIIDAKYFAKTTFKNRDYDEIKKYAPVAIIKEMGYFDTNMAQSTVDYLNNADYKGKEKIAAFFKDGAFRDEAMGYFASKADEITWAHIWNACKAETKDKYPDLSTEESLQKAGERFTEVVTKTQVYDSVFSRSALMRSKNGAVKMATAFMAEPTTSLNMLVNATVQAKRGKFSKKQATKIIASLVIASIINSLLQSIVTAARNDDDDKTYFEKYLAELIPNFIDNANPVNQIAFVKDVISIFQGYDVTRADMSVISDLYNSIHNLNSGNLTYEQKIESLAGSIGAFFGLPIKNVIRDINSVENIIKGAKNGNRFDSSMAKEATRSGIKEALLTDDVLAIFGFDLFFEKDKKQMMYEAIENGDKEMYKRLADNVSNPDNYIKKGLIENDKRVAEAGLAYLDSDISKAISTAKELEDDGFNYELAYKAIKAYSSEIQKAAGYKAEGEDKKYKEALETLMSSGIDKNTIKSAIDKVDLSKESSDNESKIYNKQDLVNAINSGEKSTIDTVINGNIQTDMNNGKSRSEAEKSIKSSLSSAFKEEYLSSDNSKRSQIKTKLKSTGYFDDEDFTNWEASAYNSEAMVEAFKSNDTSTIKKYVNGRIKAKVKNGMTQDNAVFGIRTSITNMYKEKYIKGNADEKAKIITIMTKTGLYGNRTDVISYIQKYWLK